MSIQEVFAEQFARVFHHYHQALAPDFSCTPELRTESWQGMPANERSRLIAAARLTLLEIASSGERYESRNDRERYFAKPGEAEWGC